MRESESELVMKGRERASRETERDDHFYGCKFILVILPNLCVELKKKIIMIIVFRK